MADKAGEDTLWRAIHRTPIIDNHAHPLLRPASLGKHPLLAVATEAHGPALESSRRSLAHARATRQLSRVLGCQPTWEAVERAVADRRRGDYEAWIARCLEGIECVLVDDGLDAGGDVDGYDYFDEFTRGESKRIVRIEPLAAELIEKHCQVEEDSLKVLGALTNEFMAAVREAIRDPEVVGFKSVICYRTGLAIPRELDHEKACEVFTQIHRQRVTPGAQKFTRLDHSGLNEYFVHLLALTISEGPLAPRKPIQFHTGLGDNDITLTSASPSHLQGFIRAYPDVPVVLLHSGYPYTRELGYLAATYANVYADIGEVFPLLSRDGQEGVGRQILELCPASKILWSTDGHWFPEMYLLAVVQVREALWTVLRDYVRKEDLTAQQAVAVVEDVFFHNSNKLYNLGLEFKPLEGEQHDRHDEKSGSSQDDVGAISKFLGGEDEPRLLRIYWCDMTGTERMRAVPIRRVLSMLRDGEELSFGVAKASMGLLQVDMPAPGVSPSGEWRLHPDLSTLRLGSRKGHIVARGDFRETDGSAVALCPRTTLKRVLDKARAQGLTFVLGFEIELVLMRRGKDTRFEPLGGDGHAWSVGRAMDHEAAIEVIEEAIAILEEAGVYIDMVHPESAEGQYEVILPKAPALEAVDTLLYARDVISSCATAKGYRMTLHPKPFATACGTAAHVHMSISSPGGDDPATYGPFYAGILGHLRAVSAFTYSSPASYERVVDGCWAGGTWVAWGTQNRETPLRAVEGSHWEVKAMDGTANAYLALAALLGAGTLGHGAGEQLLGQWGDCGDEAPAAMTAQRRAAVGVAERIPSSLGEALGALGEDGELGEMLGRELVDRYVSVKTAEAALLEGMGVEERRTWVMERY